MMQYHHVTSRSSGQSTGCNHGRKSRGGSGVATPPHYEVRGLSMYCNPTSLNLKKFYSQNRIFCEYVLFICSYGVVAFHWA